MQVDPGFSQLTPRLLSGTFRDFQLLKLKYDKLLSNSAFNRNLRHYMLGAACGPVPLHDKSSTVVYHADGVGGVVRRATRATECVAAQPPPGYSEAVAAARHVAGMSGCSSSGSGGGGGGGGGGGTRNSPFTSSASISATPLGGTRAPAGYRNVPFPCAADVAALVEAAEGHLRQSPITAERLFPPLLASGEAVTAAQIANIISGSSSGAAATTAMSRTGAGAGAGAGAEGAADNTGGRLTAAVGKLTKAGVDGDGGVTLQGARPSLAVIADDELPAFFAAAAVLWAAAPWGSPHPGMHGIFEVRLGGQGLIHSPTIPSEVG